MRCRPRIQHRQGQASSARPCIIVSSRSDLPSSLSATASSSALASQRRTRVCTSDRSRQLINHQPAPLPSSAPPAVCATQPTFPQNLGLPPAACRLAPSPITLLLLCRLPPARLPPVCCCLRCRCRCRCRRSPGLICIDGDAEPRRACPFLAAKPPCSPRRLAIISRNLLYQLSGR